MGDIRSGNGDPDKWDRDKPVVTAQQATRANVSDIFDAANKKMIDAMNRSIFGRWTMYEQEYLLFDKKTKDYEECKTIEEAKGCVDAWLDQGATMEDIVVYAVSSKYEVRPSPPFRLVEIDDGSD